MDTSSTGQIPTSAPATSTDDPDVHAYLSNSVRDTLDAVARTLRDLADEVERTALPGPDRDDPGFADVANGVVLAVNNCLPNLGLTLLMNRCAQADRTLLVHRMRRLSGDLPR